MTRRLLSSGVALLLALGSAACAADGRTGDESPRGGTDSDVPGIGGTTGDSVPEADPDGARPGGAGTSDGGGEGGGRGDDADGM